MPLVIVLSVMGFLFLWFSLELYFLETAHGTKNATSWLADFASLYVVLAIIVSIIYFLVF